MTWINNYSKYLISHSAYGIEIIWNGENDISCNAVELIKKRDEVEIVTQYINLESFDSLFRLINRNHPVLLNIDGKGIVHKPVKLEDQNQESIESDKLVHQVFPNFSENDFYIQQTLINPQLLYFTLVRKEYIRRIVHNFTINGYSILNISLGPFVIKQFQDILRSYDQLHTNIYCLKLNNGEIDKFTREESVSDISYNIGNEKVSSNILMAYSIGFNHYINNGQILVTDEGEKLKEEYLYKNAFKYSSYASIIFFFILLLMNFLFFDKFSKQLTNANVKLEQRKELVNKLNLLEKEISLKESFFNSNRFLETSKVSYYADRLACNLPSGIVLNELVFFPRERSQLNKDELKFRADLIMVSGTTYNTEHLNSWIRIIKQEGWVHTLNMTGLNQKETSFVTNFELEITIK